MEVGLCPGQIVLDGDPAPFPKKGAHLQFLAHVCCGQMAGWIKVPLGTMVGFGLGNVVLDADPASPQKGTHPNFQPMSVVAKRSPISATAEHLLNILRGAIFCGHGVCVIIKVMLQSTIMYG